jgi:hypothetical protein
MKAIVNVSKGSAYAKYNGLTFEVRQLLNEVVALVINEQTVDFYFKEVVIVEVKKELENAFNNNKVQDFVKLKKYAELNGIVTGAESIYGNVEIKK